MTTTKNATNFSDQISEQVAMLMIEALAHVERLSDASVSDLLSCDATTARQRISDAIDAINADEITERTMLVSGYALNAAADTQPIEKTRTEYRRAALRLVEIEYA